ncbi:Thromboxane-A synthase [Tyrophagus putrescentiae]|nr:Thromboxane-A synthase [Tyrophagus putrescentiae]
MILLYSLLFILFTLLFAAYLHRRRAMSILARHGIPGPKPNLLFGNMFTHLEKVRSIGNVRTYNEYFAQYGKVMGYYVGKKPTILVNDVELIRRIQIKDFANFADREQPTLKYGLHPNPRFFISAKLKTMTATMSSCTDIFLDKVQKKANSGEEFDLYQAFQLLTTDVIAKTALGIDTDVQNNPDDEFFQAAKALFDIRPNALFLAFLWFPELDSVLYPLRRGIEIVKEYLNLSRDQTLSRLVAAAIKLREGEIKKKNDLLQLMLDAKASDEEIRNTSLANLTIDLSKEEKSEKETSSTTNNSSKKDIKALTADEIVANAIIFYEAGYETTSTALGFIAHFLVNYPEVQEKVREEVLALNGQFDYSSLGKLPYMEQVVCEAMRFYPPVTSFVTRTAREDYHYGSMTIPAGTRFAFPPINCTTVRSTGPRRRSSIRSASPRTGSRPLTRFSTSPSGQGREILSIGMRFAQMEIRLTLARLLSKFRLVPGPSTEKELTIDYKFITETPKNGVWVKAVPV